MACHGDCRVEFEDNELEEAAYAVMFLYSSGLLGILVSERFLLIRI